MSEDKMKAYTHIEDARFHLANASAALHRAVEAADSVHTHDDCARLAKLTRKLMNLTKERARRTRHGIRGRVVV